ncbi:MAG TPA: MazG nucleotide pyrophosphohydrolase domain-containing protein [Acidimicrobiales bacterium]|nr:MazG nucleotide pyrophosphohydrolase domain-containing protein [Acidimicrobiales bacterium]
MSRPVVRVVGLGPSDAGQITARTRELIGVAPVARLRTRVHPAAAEFTDVVSYDEWYERASSFDDLYDAIVEDLAGLAASSPTREVLYVVPGSPTVAESTVERLRVRGAVEVICEPAVSVIDLACAVLGRDPMTLGLRIVDALDGADPWRGPGPLLVLQAYSPEVLAVVAERVAPDCAVTVLHHLGLADQRVEVLEARRLATFAADHLTSLWVDELRTAGTAVDDLVELARRLRRDCPWDVAQTHASLTRHLLEESYEALDALETFVQLDARGELTDAAVAHVEEELGDLLIQVVFHALLGDEEGRFDLTSIADAERAKLIARHPHVFGDVVARDAAEVAARWEVLKRDEKGRTSVTDGVAWQQPSLSLYTKLARKAVTVNLTSTSGRVALDRARGALAHLELDDASAPDVVGVGDTAPEWGDALSALVEAARLSGVDLEGVMRERALRLRDEIRDVESQRASTLDE